MRIKPRFQPETGSIRTRGSTPQHCFSSSLLEPRVQLIVLSAFMDYRVDRDTKISSVHVSARRIEEVEPLVIGAREHRGLQGTVSPTVKTT